MQVTLTDASNVPDVLPDGISVDDYVVHQQDVQAVVNALWEGGAEAMMLMDQRVISTSAVRCVGNTLILQGRVYSPPYVITAIGNQSDLRASLDRSPSVAIYKQWVDAVGRRLRRADPARADLPRLRGLHQPRDAQGPPGEGWRAGPSASSATCWSPPASCCCCSSGGSCGSPTSRPTAPRTPRSPG